MISLIAAIGNERQIGYQGQIPWRLPEDLANFKRVTLNHPVIMGRKTFESIGRPLPGRLNIVLSSQVHEGSDQLKWFTDFEDAISAAKSADPKEVFLIGGTQIYELGLPIADRFYRTIVNYSGPADAYFPEYEDLFGAPIEHRVYPASADYPSWTFAILHKKPC